MIQLELSLLILQHSAKDNVYRKVCAIIGPEPSTRYVAPMACVLLKHSFCSDL